MIQVLCKKNEKLDFFHNKKYDKIIDEIAQIKFYTVFHSNNKNNKKRKKEYI